MSNALFYWMHTKALSQRNWLSLCTVAVEPVSFSLIVCMSVCSGSRTFFSRRISKRTFILSGRVCLWWPAEVILCNCLRSKVQAESWTLKTEWLPLSLKLFAFVWNGWAEFDGDARGIASPPFPCRGLSWLKDWVIFRLENDQTVELWAWQVNPSCFMILRWLSNPPLCLL